MTHDHEQWQLLDHADGGKYCGACGEMVSELKETSPIDEHDPLCEWSGRITTECSQCEVIYRVREGIGAAIEAMPAGWHAFQRLPANTSHVAYIHENGEVYEPDTGWTDGVDVRLAEAKDVLYPLIKRTQAAEVARGVIG